SGTSQSKPHAWEVHAQIATIRRASCHNCSRFKVGCINARSREHRSETTADRQVFPRHYPCLRIRISLTEAGHPDRDIEVAADGLPVERDLVAGPTDICASSSYVKAPACPVDCSRSRRVSNPCRRIRSREEADQSVRRDHIGRGRSILYPI